jgi:hypothetical protein
MGLKYYRIVCYGDPLEISGDERNWKEKEMICV